MTLCKSRHALLCIGTYFMDPSFLFRLTLTIFPVAIIPGFNLQFLKLEFHIPLKSPPGSNRLYDAFDLISHSHFYFCIYRTKSSKNIFPSLSSSNRSNSASQSMSSSFPTHWRTSLIFSSLRKRFFFIVFFGFTSSLWKSCKKYQTNICLYRTLTWDLHCSQWSV